MDRITVAGVFRQPGDFAYRWLAELNSQLHNPEFIIVWDRDEDIDVHRDRESLPDLTVLSKERILSAISRIYEISASLLRREAESYKPLYKILTAFYCRVELKLDYLIMTDDDLFLIKPIPEIGKLAETQTPFIIPECESSDRLSAICDFIEVDLGWEYLYKPPTQGKGYNVGLMGLDLRMLDGFGARIFGKLISTLASVDFWTKEQAFFVGMMFSFHSHVHTFSGQKYLFLKYNDLRYPLYSKIYHCIGTGEKDRHITRYADAYGFTASNPLSLFGKLFAGWAGFTKHFLAAVLSHWSRLCLPIREMSVLAVRGILRKHRPSETTHWHMIDHVLRNSCRRVLEIKMEDCRTARALFERVGQSDLQYRGVRVTEESLGRSEPASIPYSICRIKPDWCLWNGSSRTATVYSGNIDEIFREVEQKEAPFDCILIRKQDSLEALARVFDKCLALLQDNGSIFIDGYTDLLNQDHARRFIDRWLLHDDKYIISICNRWVSINSSRWDRIARLTLVR